MLIQNESGAWKQLGEWEQVFECEGCPSFKIFPPDVKKREYASCTRIPTMYFVNCPTCSAMYELGPLPDYVKHYGEPVEG